MGEMEDLEGTLSNPRDEEVAVDTSTVQLLYSAPSERYQVIKEISVEKKTPKQAESALIKKAEELGANAILLNGFPKLVKNHSVCSMAGKAIIYI